MQLPGDKKIAAAFIWSGERPRHSIIGLLRAQSICCMTS